VASIDRMSLLELLRKSGSDGDVDFLREALNVLVHSLMEAEVAAQIGAERYERNPERTNQRNGYRQREWHIRVGTLDLSIPKLRKGSCFPSKQSHSHKDLH
jgi:transposase-like protein